MNINVTHRGIELTPAIRQYVEEKMQSLEKYCDSIQLIAVEVGVETHHHKKGKIFECKAVVQLNGHAIRFGRDAEDLYKAIDKVRDHLRVELAEYKKMKQEVK